MRNNYKKPKNLIYPTVNPLFNYPKSPFIGPHAFQDVYPTVYALERVKDTYDLSSLPLNTLLGRINPHPKGVEVFSTDNHSMGVVANKLEAAEGLFKLWLAQKGVHLPNSIED